MAEMSTGLRWYWGSSPVDKFRSVRWVANSDPTSNPFLAYGGDTLPILTSYFYCKNIKRGYSIGRVRMRYIFYIKTILKACLSQTGHLDYWPEPLDTWRLDR